MNAFVPFALLAAGLLSAAAPLDDSDAMELEVGLAQPVLPAGRRNVAHLRVSLIGVRLPEPAQRAPVNVCLAIDRSGSMRGERLANARQGAIAALRLLGPRDIVSVVAYDDVVEVMVPATHASDRDSIEAGIRRLEPGGRAALFAGVVKCQGELRKHLGRDRGGRIIVLSHGSADVGPSSPSELGALGAQLADEGITVSTVGLGAGYNDDLMSELSTRSDGGHLFVERAEELGGFLDGELAAASAVVARDVDVRVRCAPGVRPLRVLGRPADFVGDTVTAHFARIYARQRHSFVLVMEVAPAAGSSRRLADVAVGFHDLVRRRPGQREQTVVARFSTRPRAPGNPRPGVSQARQEAKPVDARTRLFEILEKAKGIGNGPLDGLQVD
jgi:Ca-activated chloride channel family protein